MNPVPLSITYRTKGKLSRLPFVPMKNALLGSHYELSLAVIGQKRMRNLNRVYRGEDSPTDILSFSLSKNSGEIFLNLKKAEQKARSAGTPLRDYLGFLFIHGLLHLKGLSHSGIMKNEERTWCQKFSISLPE